MAAFIVTFVVVVGLNTLLWVSSAVTRVVAARIRAARERFADRDADHASALTGSTTPDPDSVAVIIAAHNEELVIAETIRSAARQVPVEHIFVVSDGSHDGTVAIAQQAGATVLDLQPNRGKAGAIRAAIDELGIADAFEVVVLLDADSQLSDEYLASGLAQFSDPDVVAVAGRATTLLDPRPPTRMGRLLVAYRERLYLSVQYLQKFGQAARHLNAVSIVPGFASMYRTRILADIDIDAPGLVIEDYNMTFEVHAKSLGRIAFRPSAAIALTQDPDNLRDYRKQVHRWSLGFWQTVRRHGMHRGRFWLFLALSIGELVTSSIFMVLTIPVIIVGLVASVFADVDPSGVSAGIVAVIPPLAVILGVVVPDYLLTILAALHSGRPGYLIRGFAFPLLRILDAVICLRAMGDAVAGSADGRWASPGRRTVASS